MRTWKSSPRPCSRWPCCTRSRPSSSSGWPTAIPVTPGCSTCSARSRSCSASGPSCWWRRWAWSPVGGRHRLRRVPQLHRAAVRVRGHGRSPRRGRCCDGDARRRRRRWPALLPLPTPVATAWLGLAAVPLMGSLVTEPAAMTIAALMLAPLVFRPELPERLKYVALGVLFVNVSIGGTLTSYAAPPVLMVAATWNWDSAFMLAHLRLEGGASRSLVNATVATLRAAPAPAPRRRRGRREPPAARCRWPVVAGAPRASWPASCCFAHHPVVFLGLFLLFLGFTQAYERHQSPLILQGGAAGRLLPRRAGGARRHAALVAAAARLGPGAAGAVLRRARPDGDHRQRRADLPRLADRRHVGRRRSTCWSPARWPAAG